MPCVAIQNSVQEIRKLLSFHYLASAWDRFGYLGDHMGKLQIVYVQDLGGACVFFLLQETGNESILRCDRPLVNNLSSISARPIRFSFIFSRFGFSSNQEICMSCSLQWREIR